MSSFNRAESLCIEESIDYEAIGKNLADDVKADFEGIEMLETYIENKSNEQFKTNRGRVEKVLAVNELEHMLSLKLDRIIGNMTRAVTLSRCDGNGFELSSSVSKHFLSIIKSIRSITITCIKRESLEEERARTVLQALRDNIPSTGVLDSVLYGKKRAEKAIRDRDEMLLASENLAEAIYNKRKRIETRISTYVSPFIFEKCWCLECEALKNDGLKKEISHTIGRLEAAISADKIKFKDKNGK